MLTSLSTYTHTHFYNVIPSGLLPGRKVKPQTPRADRHDPCVYILNMISWGAVSWESLEPNTLPLLHIINEFI